MCPSSRRPHQQRQSGETRGRHRRRPSSAAASRPARSHSMSTIHSGIVETRSAAVPDGSFCSAHTSAAVAAEEQESADQRRRAPVDAARPRRAAPARPAVEDGAGDQIAHAGHEKRRDRLDRHRDRQIGRAPEDVDRAEGERHLQHGRRLAVVFNQGTPPPRPGFRDRLGEPRRRSAAASSRAVFRGRSSMRVDRTDPIAPKLWRSSRLRLFASVTRTLVR